MIKSKTNINIVKHLKAINLLADLYSKEMTDKEFLRRRNEVGQDSLDWAGYLLSITNGRTIEEKIMNLNKSKSKRDKAIEKIENNNKN